MVLGIEDIPCAPLLHMMAAQIKVSVAAWQDYGHREQTRREHLLELKSVLGFKSFTGAHYLQAIQMLTDSAMHTDKGIVLAMALVDNLREQSIILPAMGAIDRGGCRSDHSG